jgi:ribose 5-phosphate isomerase A
LSKDDQKKAAALAALKYVKDGMTLGLGTGSTAAHFVRALGERVAGGLTVRCAATSVQTENLAQEVGVPILPLDEVGALDLTVDGADELDNNLCLTKGGGGALLREKIVAAASRHMIVIADAAKAVPILGAYPLPVEVIRFGAQTTERAMETCFDRGGFDAPTTTLRKTKDGTPFITDSGNIIFDCALGKIPDPEGLARALNAIPGVVEHGLFIGLASIALLGQDDAPENVRRIEGAKAQTLTI